MSHRARDITVLLEQTVRDAHADEALFHLVKERFQHIARALLWRERLDVSVQATMLVDDAFLKLIQDRQLHWPNREAFFAQAARIMRRLLVDHARARLAEKRGGGQQPVPLETGMAEAVHTQGDPAALIALVEILQRLEQQYPEVFKVFDLHYFMQYELKEIAEEILDISYTTVRRRWKMARAFLHRELVGEV